MVTKKSKQERKSARQQLGTLRSLTVAGRTRTRYKEALKAFYLYAQMQRVRIPSQAAALDELFADYIENLWEEGESLSFVTDGLSGLQDLRPQLRGHLCLSWRLVRTWQRREVPQRAPPLPEDLLQSLCGFFLFKQQPFMSLALETGFYSVLRTGELLQLQAKHIDVSPNQDFAVISLGLTKTSQRSGTHDSVTLRVAPVCERLQRWKQQAQPTTFLVPVSEFLFRKAFDEALSALQVSAWGFRPYSLRRGGATMYWRKNPNMDAIRHLGRWSSDRTARLYIQDGLARLAEMHFQISKPPLRQFYSLYCRESLSLRNPGGRG